MVGRSGEWVNGIGGGRVEGVRVDVGQVVELTGGQDTGQEVQEVEAGMGYSPEDGLRNRGPVRTPGAGAAIASACVECSVQLCRMEAVRELPRTVVSCSYICWR